MFIETCLSLKDGLNPSKIYIFTDDDVFLEEIIAHLTDFPIIVATSRKPVQRALKEKYENVRIKRLSGQPATGITTLKEIKDLLLSALAEGLLRKDDRVLCVVSTDIQLLMSFDVNKLGASTLIEKVGDRLSHNIIEVAMTIASQIAVEGKEGKPAGALLILGDTEDVMENSRQIIKNPFEGHKREECHILDENNIDTIKEFALLDGGVIIDREGYVISAGRYVVNISFDLLLSGGLGGRHLAGASISQTTKAVSIVISSTGTVRVFKDGEEVYQVGVL